MNLHHVPAPDPRPLSDLLRQAAHELQAQPVPPMPEALLRTPEPLARPAAAGAGSRKIGGWFAAPRLVFGGAFGAAVVLLAATWLVLSPTLPAGPRGADPARLAGGELPFVPVASAERWVRLAGEGASPAWLMTAEMPAERLAAYGLPYDPSRAAERVRTELLLNPAGEVLALRVMNPAPR